jgi:hypothetical protein
MGCLMVWACCISLELCRYRSRLEPNQRGAAGIPWEALFFRLAESRKDERTWGVPAASHVAKGQYPLSR